MTINAGEYGLALNLNVNYDLSNATSLQILFTRPDDTTFTGVPVMQSTSLSTSDQGVFSAKQYAKYTFLPGDLTIPGAYRVRLVYTDNAPKRLVSDITSFDVSL